LGAWGFCLHKQTEEKSESLEISEMTNRMFLFQMPALSSAPTQTKLCIDFCHFQERFVLYFKNLEGMWQKRTNNQSGSQKPPN
jgi:hypothetical protein